jgi:division protein CdvB (Snf7/Vps24/ESCRT-III family)
MKKSDEEKVAENVAKMMNDLTLDLDQIGVYLGRIRPATSFRRLEIIMEAAREEREDTVDYDRYKQDTLF